MEFNPIDAARTIENSYREYISTTIHFSDADLQHQLEDILNRSEYLAKGPYLEAAPPYRKGRSISELVQEGVVCRSLLTLGNSDRSKFDPDRPLYVHQERALRKATEGRNFAVVTGTGSGKTECFLLPILNDILSEFETDEPSAGVRAMILYPMNALANDQLKRLREMLVGTPITFGRYTGDTEESEADAKVKWAEENPGASRLPNELISREEIRRNPPNILLTNYSMLEYLLLRPKDAPLFGSVFGSNWRHLAIDEAHVYSGSLGTEIAYLIRRLKARIESETGTMPRLHCYATSATIGSEDDMPKVAEFAQSLFGEPFSNDDSDLDVITSVKDLPVDALDSESWGTLPLSAWRDLRLALNDRDTVSIDQIVGILRSSAVPDTVLSRMEGKAPLLGLGSVLLGESSTMKLVTRCSGDKESSLLDLTDISSIDDLGIDGLSGDADGVTILTAMVEVLSAAQRSADVPILSSRYHSFLRAPEGLFINLHTRKLSPTKALCEKYQGDNSTPVYEVSVCRHCGQAYILGTEKMDATSRAPWIDPRHDGDYQDDDIIPRKYYRLLPSEGDKDEDEDVLWLCPVCGSVHSEQDGGPHLFEHEKVFRIPIALDEAETKQATEISARCRHCGYQSAVAIQPMRVSPEAAGSVVCYDLVREIPPFKREDSSDDDWFDDASDEGNRGGSVICFSDRRQDAAFFAPAMDRTYGEITRRQLIREAVDAKDEGSGCSFDEIVNRVHGMVKNRYPQIPDGSDKDQIRAWLLDELEAEDSRNSLEGLGMIKVCPTAFSEGLRVQKIQKIINRQLQKLSNRPFGSFTVDDYALMSLVFLDFLRERGAIEVPEGVCTLRSNHAKKGNWVVCGGESKKRNPYEIPFAGSGPSTTENAFSAFVRKYASSIYGVELTREDATAFLCSMYSFLYQYLFHLGKHCGTSFIADSSSEQRFILRSNLWRFYRHHDSDVIYRCDKCGCEIHLDTHGVCITHKCDGTMRPIIFSDAKSKDRYYRNLYSDEALPLDIEEHTAQLSTEKARRIQSQFIKGEVNILSCTTTFELGVDVGDLRAVFMRNVPPSAANYTQRAGRVGRRAGMPGFAITFARLRPHDVAYFGNPERIINGETPVPICYLNNEQIALRHIFATVLSEYFRFAEGRDEECNVSHYYHDFLNLGEEVPKGLDDLRAFLDIHPVKLDCQLSRVLADSPELEGLKDWKWVGELVGAPTPENEAGGRLVRTHALKHADYERINSSITTLYENSDSKVGSLFKVREALERQLTISVLAENGVLPKYGFPTDLVELHLPEQDESSDENRLSLTRGLRQAIREYAPGSEVVADKTLWRSTGVRLIRGHKLEERRFGHCENCGTFVWPIENYESTAACPVCGATVTLSKNMLIPSYGFVGTKVSRGVGLRKPRAHGSSRVYFSQHWPKENKSDFLTFDGGILTTRFAANGQLCALNEPRGKFRVCPSCGAAVSGGDKFHHLKWCPNAGGGESVRLYDALGAAFVSDVLQLDILLAHPVRVEEADWESVMWALFAAAAKMLEVPESEIGGTYYASSGSSSNFSLMLYDNVPGGAGYTLQLSNRAEELINAAYRVVDGHCGCSEETCCYGCIANYYNQGRQSKLSRGAAKRVLGALLGKQ